MVDQLRTFFLAGLMSMILCLGPWTPSQAQGLRVPVIAALPGISSFTAGLPPEDLGVKNGELTACPPSPNCVVSQGADPDHQIDPLTYQGDRETARQALLKVLTVVPRTQVLELTDAYIHFISSSALLGFIDDGEFYLPTDSQIIQMRSAARIGESDLGVNRRRLEQIRLALKDLGI